MLIVNCIVLPRASCIIPIFSTCRTFYHKIFPHLDESRMPEYQRKLQEGCQEEKETYPVFMHWRPSAHLGVSLDKIPLVHDSPSFLSSWHFPPSNTWTKQKRPALHWLSSPHGDPARPVRSEKQNKFNKIKNQNTLIMIM